MLFVKEIFCLATSPSTLTSELMSRTWAGGLEPGSHQWNSSHRVGLGVRGQAWTPPPRGTRASLRAVYLPVSPLATGQTSLGGKPWVWACLYPVGCIRKRVQEGS